MAKYTATDNGFPKHNVHVGRKHQHRPSHKVLQARRNGKKQYERMRVELKRRFDRMVTEYFTGLRDQYPT